jgi:hypothetical protein
MLAVAGIPDARNYNTFCTRKNANVAKYVEKIGLTNVDDNYLY